MNQEEVWNENAAQRPRAALVGVVIEGKGETEADCIDSLDELAGLLDTAGGTAALRILQTRERPDAKTYIGSGKLKELSEACGNQEIPLVVFDCELSPSQIRNIESYLENVRVIDRTMLILDIFSLHAVTGEGRLQVEIAHLKYTMPRLYGKGLEMSRLGGGIGTRGPGESQLEKDRRHIKTRIAHLERELRELGARRETRRKQRTRSGVPQIAVAGYTNVGKSTLLNALTGSDIPAEDKLFATLDPTARKLILPDAGEAVITDTVGFISNLPHHLVEAFRSTLNEVVFADLILVLLDASSKAILRQYQVTERLLLELFEESGTEPKPVLYAFNKCDLIADSAFLTDTAGAVARGEDTVLISAKTGEGIDALLRQIERKLQESKRDALFRFPLTQGGYLNHLYRNATVKSVEYTGDSIVVCAVVDRKIRGQYRDYIVPPRPDAEELV